MRVAGHLPRADQSIQALEVVIGRRWLLRPVGVVLLGLLRGLLLLLVCHFRFSFH